MHLFCAIGWHRAIPHDRWNRGYYFSKCRGCGRDLVRTAAGRWHVPRGYRVVWKPNASDFPSVQAPDSAPFSAGLENRVQLPAPFAAANAPSSAQISPEAAPAASVSDETDVRNIPLDETAKPGRGQADDRDSLPDRVDIVGGQQAGQVLPSMGGAREILPAPEFHNDVFAEDFMVEDDISDLPVVPSTALPTGSLDDFMRDDVDGSVWGAPRPVHVAFPDFGEDFMADREDMISDHLSTNVGRPIETRETSNPNPLVELKEAETGQSGKKARRSRKKSAES